MCVWSAQPLQQDEDALYAVTSDNGVTWSPVSTLNSRADVDGQSLDNGPTIATDGQGVWICAWESTDDLGGQVGNDNDILFAVSTDNGASWSPQAAVDVNAAIEGNRDIDPSVATDGHGTWVIGWVSHQTRFGAEGDPVYSVSSDAGATWSEPAAINPDAVADSEYDGDVKICSDPNGNWIAVWISMNPLGGLIGYDIDLLYSISALPSAGWSRPAPMNSSAYTDGENSSDSGGKPVDDGNGHWVASWAHRNLDGDAYGDDYDVFVCRFDLRRLGDLDFDGDVDLADFSRFAHCYGGSSNPPSTSCDPSVDADFDADGDVDLADFSRFAANFTGAR
jgi:hypothetical protein